MQSFDIIKTPLLKSCLIEAGAGTGKTYTIASIVLRLIVYNRLTIDQILVVTFTNAASDELKDRIRKKLTDAKSAFANAKSDDPFIDFIVKENRLEHKQRIEEALIDFDQAKIFTIHGFCQRILQQSAFETSSLFDTELVSSQTELIRQTAEDFWRIEFYNASHELAGYAIKELKGPQFFERLFKNSYLPGIKIIPEKERPNLSALDKYRETFISLKNLWLKERDKVALILKSRSLKKNIYGERSEKLLSEMDRFIAGTGFPLFKDFEKSFEKFTADKLYNSFKKGEKIQSHKVFDISQELFDLYQKLSKEIDELMIFLKGHFIRYAEKQLLIRKKSSNVWFFDDLLTAVQRSIKNDAFVKSVRQKYKAALVDEFQDTDSIQYEIFSRLFACEKSILFMIGDPRQAIYSFRGADIFSYIRASAEAVQKNTMTKNWRSSNRLLTAVNTVFSSVPSPFLFDEIRFAPGVPAQKDDSQKEPALTILFMQRDDELQQKKFVNKTDASYAAAMITASNIKEMIKDTPPCDIAVLVRKNKQAKLIQNALLKQNISYVVCNAESVFETPEAEELETVLRAIVKHGDQNALKSALITSIIGVSPDIFDFEKKEMDRLEDISIDFRQYLDIWQNAGFLPMFYAFIEKQKVKQKLIKDQGSADSFMNLLQLAELIECADIEKSRGPSGILKWFAEQRANRAYYDKENELRLKTDKSAVNIVTIHKSKGLEYPIVFCPFSWEGERVCKFKEVKFHTHDAKREQSLDLGSEDFDNNLMLAKNEMFAESLRLFYVALTRAKRQCFIVWGPISSIETSPMSYLFHCSGLHTADDLSTSITEQIEKQFKDKKYSMLIDDLQELVRRSDSSIELKKVDWPDNTIHYSVKPDDHIHLDTSPLSYKKFTGKIDKTWGISSYSSLIYRHTHDTKDRDYDISSRPKPQDFDIFSFPRGPSPGIFFHDLLENFDFTIKDKNIIKSLAQEKLKAYGFDIKWTDTILEMLCRVSNIKISEKKDSPCLETVGADNRLNEIEFYFPLKSITPQMLKIQSKDEGAESFLKAAESLGFAQTRGFMKGFIDMIFRSEGKYYIADWKSNYLGNSINNYDNKSLSDTMIKEHYILQSSIYTLALYRYIKTFKPQADFENEFGGILYIFIRGLDLKTDSGVYRGSADINFIKALENIMIDF